jgi:RNA polymerase primary sigma factor
MSTIVHTNNTRTTTRTPADRSVHQPATPTERPVAEPTTPARAPSAAANAAATSRYSRASTDAFGDYLRRIGKGPLLSAEDEACSPKRRSTARRPTALPSAPSSSVN